MVVFPIFHLEKKNIDPKKHLEITPQNQLNTKLKVFEN